VASASAPHHPWMVGRREPNPHEREVGVPSLWPRRGGALQQHGLGVFRQADRGRR